MWSSSRVARWRKGGCEGLSKVIRAQVRCVILPVSTTNKNGSATIVSVAVLRTDRFVGLERKQIQLPLLNDSKDLGPVPGLGLLVYAIQMMLVGNHSFLDPWRSGEFERFVFEELRCRNV
ncbi:hypothetical protein HG531_011827 [Fusarium graminearum]|nr:hypothetical protein HG531_011827 [Fusarium graminearum]